MSVSARIGEILNEIKSLKKKLEEISPMNPEKEALFAPLKKLEKLPQNFPYPEPAPKYDPNRKFREGDIVTPCSVKGRWLSEAWEDRAGIRFIVTMSEDADGCMLVKDLDSHNSQKVDAVYFLLVTPVEELEPYIVYENINVCGVMHRDEKDGKFIAVFFNSQYGRTIARERAEAERDRLNAEYRKEMEK